MLFAVVVLAIGWRGSLSVGGAGDLLRWLRVAPCFAGVLLTSVLALKEAPITLVVVIRSLAPLCSLCIERLHPKPLVVDHRTVFALLMILFGALLYCKDMPRSASNLRAIGWVLLNNAFAVADRNLQRLMLAQDQAPVDISKSAAVLINNLVGIVPMAAVALATGESLRVPA